MKKVKVVALQAHTYDAVRYEAGSEYEANENELPALVSLGWSREAVAPAAKPVTVRQAVDADKKVKKEEKRSYSTRDMKAKD